MPEGDVLRRAAAALDGALAGRALVRAELRWPSAAGVDLVGSTVLGTRPFGKHLLTRFDTGLTLHTHLRMDGSLRVAPGPPPSRLDRDHRVRALLAGPDAHAAGTLLGMLDVVRTRDERTLVGHLGPDLLDDGFDPDDDAATGVPPGRTGPRGIDAPGGGAPPPGLAEALTRFTADPARPVAEVLLDQRVVAGIGTIYTAESLFVRRLWPWTPAADVADPAALLRTARTLMLAAVRTGLPPSRVHGRARRPCPRCGTPIRQDTARRPPQERPVFWCPRCQAPPGSR